MLLETHSEHLIAGLQILIANGTVRPEDVALYFVDKPSSRSEIRRIVIDDDGHIPPESWPPDFMNEAVTLALKLAEAQREQRSRKKKRTK